MSAFITYSLQLYCRISGAKPAIFAVFINMIQTTVELCRFAVSIALSRKSQTRPSRPVHAHEIKLQSQEVRWGQASLRNVHNVDSARDLRSPLITGKRGIATLLCSGCWTKGAQCNDGSILCILNVIIYARGLFLFPLRVYKGFAYLIHFTIHISCRRLHCVLSRCGLYSGG